MPRRLGLLVATVATLSVVLPLGWFWQRSLLPTTYSAMNMGYADYGHGPNRSG